MKFSKTIFTITCAAALLSACGGRKDNTSETSTFRVERVTLETSLSEGNEDRREMSKAKNFQFKACITDIASLDSIKRAQFSVSDGESKILSETNNSGCLYWNELHPMSPTSSERMVRFQRTFIGEGAFKGSVVVDLAMNPWTGELYDLHIDNSFEQDKMKLPRVNNKVNFTFNADPMFGEESPGFNAPFNQGTDENETVDTTDHRAEILLSQIRLTYVGLDKSKSQIDSLLTLKTVQQYELKLEPKFLRWNLQNKSIMTEITSGRFNLALLFVKDGVDIEKLTPSDVSAHFVGDFEVGADGVISQDKIDIVLDDLASTLSRTRLYVTLRPYDEAAQLYRPNAYMTHVTPSRTAVSSYTLVPVQEQRDSVLNKTRELMNTVLNSSVTGLDLYAKEPGVVLDTTKLGVDLTKDLSESDLSKLRKQYCDLIYKEGEVVKVKTLGIFENDKDARKTCRSNTKKYVSLSKREYVQEVQGQPTAVGIPWTAQIKVARTLKYSQTDNKTSGYSVKGNLGLELGPPGPLKFLGDILGIKIGVSGETYWVTKAERVVGKEVTSSVSDEETMGAFSDTYEFTVVTRTCLVANSATGEGKGRVFINCMAPGAPKKVRETYYVVRQRVENSPFTDDEQADGGAQWRLYMRGDAQYQAFQKLMTTENTVLRFSPIVFEEAGIPQVDLKNPLIPAFKINQDYPGMLSGSVPLQ